MKRFWDISAFLNRRLTWVIPITVLAAVILGAFFDFASWQILTLPLTVLVVFPIMIGMQLQAVFSLDDTRVQAATQLLNFAVIPFVGYALVRLFFADQAALAMGMLLVALLPTSGGMTIAWTEFGKGNVQAAVKMTVIGLILGALIAPLYINFLLGEAIAIPLPEIVRQVAIIVVVPLILGQLFRWLLIRRYGSAFFQEQVSPKLPGLAVWGLIGLIFLAIALKAERIIANPIILIQISIPLLIFYLVNYALVSFIGRQLLSRADAIALVYGTALRSLSVALAMTITIFRERGAEIALLVAVAYIIQIQSASWYLKLTDKIYGAGT